jgi:hypothetical protein
MNYATRADSYQLRQPIPIAFKALSHKKNSRNHAMKLNIISTFINPKEVQQRVCPLNPMLGIGSGY